MKIKSVYHGARRENQHMAKAKNIHHRAHGVHGEKQDMAKAKAINHGEKTEAQSIAGSYLNPCPRLKWFCFSLRTLRLCGKCFSLLILFCLIQSILFILSKSVALSFLGDLCGFARDDFSHFCRHFPSGSCTHHPFRALSIQLLAKIFRISGTLSAVKLFALAISR